MSRSSGSQLGSGPRYVNGEQLADVLGRFGFLLSASPELSAPPLPPGLPADFNEASEAVVRRLPHRYGSQPTGHLAGLASRPIPEGKVVWSGTTMEVLISMR